jgi:hypothetical protein
MLGAMNCCMAAAAAATAAAGAGDCMAAGGASSHITKLRKSELVFEYNFMAEVHNRLAQ